MDDKELVFEESLSSEWSGDFDVVEVPLNERPLFFVGIVILALGLIVGIRVAYLGIIRGNFYAKRAEANVSYVRRIPAPRGLILDVRGKVLAENRAVFSAALNLREFLKQKKYEAETLSVIEEVLGIPQADVLTMIKDRNLEFLSEPLLLTAELTQPQIVALKSKSLPTLAVVDNFQREYPGGEIFSSILGYIGLPTKEDLKRNANLDGQDMVGKTGLESFYDERLRGRPGAAVKTRDAKGNILSEEEKTDAKIGAPLELTIDAELQEYFYERFREGLISLGRTSGVGLALNPQNGEILSLINFPAYDNNIFTHSGNSEAKKNVLTSSARPLFNRAVSGLYSPGSTIKPLVATAALTEGVVTPQKSVFSPGYLDVPNPYDPDQPTRFLDWRFQGNVNAASAIAQSSNVYFYAVGGGAFDIKGLGISRLREWWQKFHLGEATGIDLPGEAKGFLPSPEWKEKASGKAWLLGDTYNVAIGQGDLIITPVQLLSYIGAMANGGKIWRPVIVKTDEHEVIADVTFAKPAIEEVQRGMISAITAPMGTAHLLADLPMAVAGKTGSAQIQNKAAENAFFVGYAPADPASGPPQIAILILVENSKQGSLNAVPIAKDVLRWYYEHRVKK